MGHSPLSYLFDAIISVINHLYAISAIAIPTAGAYYSSLIQAHFNCSIDVRANLYIMINQIQGQVYKYTIVQTTRCEWVGGQQCMDAAGCRQYASRMGVQWIDVQARGDGVMLETSRRVTGHAVVHARWCAG